MTSIWSGVSHSRCILTAEKSFNDEKGANNSRNNWEELLLIPHNINSFEPIKRSCFKKDLDCLQTLVD